MFTRPGAGFMLIAAFAAALALLLTWTFATTRIESTIRLEEQGLKQMYRNQPAEALDYFRQSALVDTDKFHHIARYRDSLRLAIRSGNTEMAAFFLQELILESPGLIGSDEVLGLLRIQSGHSAVIELAVRLAGVEAIDRQQIKLAVSGYIKSLDEDNRPGFVQKLNQAMRDAAEQRGSE